MKIIKPTTKYTNRYQNQRLNFDFKFFPLLITREHTHHNMEADTKNTPIENTQSDTKEVKYGSNGNGEYLTPFRWTVVYHVDSDFETGVAALTSRAQLIPIGVGADLSNAASACEHPTPEVLVFGNEMSREDLLKFTQRGTELVHVFVYKPEDAKKYLLDGTDKHFDEKVITFGLDELYDHFTPVDGFVPIYALEQIMCAAFPQYKSANADINVITGKCFLNAIKYSKKQLGIVLLELCSGLRGFDKVNDLIRKGVAINEVYEHIVNDRLNRGIMCNVGGLKTCAVSGENLGNELIELAPMHPNVVKNQCKYVMSYMMGPEKDNDGIVFMGWRVVLIAIGDAPSAVETLKSLCDGVISGGNGIGTAWIPDTGARKVLPFIFENLKFY